jgi:hypothetical protein
MTGSQAGMKDYLVRVVWSVGWRRGLAALDLARRGMDEEKTDSWLWSEKLEA